MTPRKIVWFVAACVGAGLAVFYFFTMRPLWSADALVRDGRAALVMGDAAAALDSGRRAVRQAPNSVAAWRLLADAAQGAQERTEAIAALTHLAEADLSRAADYWMRIGGLEIDCFKVRRADEALRRSIVVDPGQVEAWRLRAQLQGVLGMSHEMTECLVELIRLEAFELKDLVLLAGYDPSLANPEYIDSALRADADEVLPLLARAHEAMIARRAAEAEKHLTRLVASKPLLWEAQALLGELYSERAGEGFLRWQASLPRAADSNARIWLTRGLWLRAHGHLDESCRCLWEAVKREPETPGATMPIGQTLLLRGEVELGHRFLQRAKLMQQIVSTAKQIDQHGDWSLASSLVNDLEAVGRQWEAWGWCSLQARKRPGDEVVAGRLATLARALQPGLPRTLPDAVPGHDFDWSRFALPDWSSYRTEVVLDEPTSPAANIRFVDEAEALGLDFQLVNDDDSPLERRIFQMSGAGVAALDFDGDGWTDLYFAQGGSWPVVPGRGPRDVLFRNCAGRRFDDVTGPAGIVEDRYSQGVAAGDIDNDGFPDLYVANIGRNRLFHNNGDGTFADVTEAAGLKDKAWTVSCAIADLNGDGFPDLFDVNYVQGAEVFTAVCSVNNQGGIPSVCRPAIFEAALDTVSFSRGDGRFVEMQETAGLDLPNGRGLGLLIADFNADRKLDVFVANDGQANFLLLNDSSRPGPSRHGNSCRFSEQAHALGMAFDRDGFPRAHMGIAAGDVNRDGRLDLFVTTFSFETKILYLSQPDGSYIDSTREAGLYAPTLDLLGFGTQFLDADLDGRLDLLILNGHVDTMATARPEYTMRPQFFRGLPGPRFVELKEHEAGSFFGVKRLGRALATLDWNRDGLLDFVATYLAGPAALGTNKTQPAGNSLRLKLVGTASSRDAIGARVRVVPVAGEEVFVQLTAGDGYEASCERIIQVGIGARTRVELVEIEWPSGKISEFKNVACRDAWLAIEGAARLIPMRTDLP